RACRRRCRLQSRARSEHAGDRRERRLQWKGQSPADPVALPSASRSKRGASIAGIPSFGGPPDLIPANGTLCLEKSVRGHSKRQLIGSADKVRRLASTNRPKTAVSAINLGKLPTNDAIAISRHLSGDPRPRSVRLDRFVGQLLERLIHFPEYVVVA